MRTVCIHNVYTMCLASVRMAVKKALIQREAWSDRSLAVQPSLSDQSVRKISMKIPRV